MPSLRDLAVKYNSDKLHAHSYIPFYSDVFSRMQVRRLLEIGIGFKDLMQPFVSPDAPYVHGSSLLMWEEFFPEADIFACDVREETLTNRGRIRSTVCDQGSGASLANMVWEFCANTDWEQGESADRLFEGFDVIIDDGSHQTPHQLLSFDVLYPRLNEGGVYVIEDVTEPERVAAHTGGIVHKFDKRPDDCLVVIRKDWFDV